jgi:hypothetical protein
MDGLSETISPSVHRLSRFHFHNDFPMALQSNLRAHTYHSVLFTLRLATHMCDRLHFLWVGRPATPPNQSNPRIIKLNYPLSDRRLSAKWLPTFVSVTDSYGRILGFSRQDPLLFYQVAPQLHSRGWVDPVPDSLFFLVVPGIEPGPPDL